MTAPRNTGQMLSVTLLAMALALAGLVAYEWQAGQALKTRLGSQVRASEGSPPPLAALPPFSLQPLTAYAGIVEHPLFVANRQPPPAAPASAAAPQKLVLTGIATNPAESIVLLRDLQTGKTERIKSGQPSDAGSLQLGEVQGNTVVLKQGNTELKFDLQVAPSSGRAAPAVPGPGVPLQPAQSPQNAPVVPAGARPAGTVAPPSARPGSVPNPAIDPNLQLLNAQRAKQGLPPLQP